MLKAGDKAPAVELPSAEMKMQTVADHQGSHNVVLYFYPKDDTPGCTMESLEFTDLMDEFHELDTVVIIKGDERKMGIVRSTFIIDKQGVIGHALYQVKPKGHGELILDLVRAL